MDLLSSYYTCTRICARVCVIRTATCICLNLVYYIYICKYDILCFDLPAISQVGESVFKLTRLESQLSARVSRGETRVPLRVKSKQD